MTGFFQQDQYIRKTVKCEDCPLNHRTKVWGEGSLTKGGIVFLGEAPGENEDKHGRPFVGKAGRLLNKALQEIGIRRLDNWTTNVINCRPPKNDFQATETKVALKKHCNNGLYEELDFLWEKRYKVIVPLGKNACSAFDIEGKMSEIRGTVHTFNKYIIVPTYHPSYIGRKGGVGTVEWYYWLEDLKKVKEELLLEIV
ncbi:MAG: uracil-DNA glycosylase [Nanoarchaeota archaeon]